MIAFLLLTSGVTVTLPDTVEVRGTELTVGAIATVTGDDPALVARVQAASLGYAPAPGYSRLLDRERLDGDLELILPTIEVDVAGAARCRVTPAVTSVSAASLYKEAGDKLREVFRGADARMAAVDGLVDLVVPAANQAIDLRVDLQDRVPRAGSWSVPVEIVVDGAAYRTIWTSWTVELWQRRYVLRHHVRAGRELVAGDFELARVPVAPGPAQQALDPMALGASTLLRDMAKGSVVTDRDVQRKIVIRRGDSVGIEIRRRSVTVRAMAVAKQDGRIGDRIAVSLNGSQKELVAIVTGLETVELHLD